MGSKLKTTRQLIEEAAQAHTDLNIFSTVVAIMEGGSVYTTSGQRAAQKIIKLCHGEIQKQLKVYDRTLEESDGV